MAFSVGILYSIQKFLQFIKDTPIGATEFSSAFDNFGFTSSKKVLEVAELCNWINFDTDGNITISEKGNTVLSQANMESALRVQLAHLIETYKPSWSYLLHKGRKEAFQYFPSNVKQCFKEAELINSYHIDVIRWWDILALAVRGKKQDAQLEIGRTGEELSLEYEKKRVNKIPVWQSIESNLSGFDILSVVSPVDFSPLRIEVKTTRNNSNLFTFYLSRNEWNVAEISDNYLFHLWQLNKSPTLYIIDKSHIAKHIPTNHGNGVWENVKISFSLEQLKEMDIKE